MRLEYYSQDELKKELLAIIARHLDLSKYRVFFFGSRVSGRGTDRSDIDVGIEGTEPIPAGAWLNILEEVEDIHTLYKIDLVDFSHVAQKFREVALQIIEPLNTVEI